MPLKLSFNIVNFSCLVLFQFGISLVTLFLFLEIFSLVRLTVFVYFMLFRKTFFIPSLRSLNIFIFIIAILKIVSCASAKLYFLRPIPKGYWLLEEVYCPCYLGFCFSLLCRHLELLWLRFFFGVEIWPCLFWFVWFYFIFLLLLLTLLF